VADESPTRHLGAPRDVNPAAHQIVESAAMLFDALGYGNTSMEDVALSVSIAKPTLYGSISREPSSAGTRLYRAG
jgi:hypothetical protein